MKNYCHAWNFQSETIYFADPQLSRPQPADGKFRMTSQYMERAAVLEAMGQQLYCDEAQAGHAALLE